MEDISYHLGVETGGTSCRVGVIDSSNSFKLLEFRQIPTRSPAETIADILEFVNSLPYTYSSLGVAAFGPICLVKNSPKYGFVTTTPKPGWADTDLLKPLVLGIKNKAQDLKVAFDTDVNVVAQFEAKQGGHSDLNSGNLVYITVGTGIGLGVVVNGKTVHGLVHPEGGHIKVPMLPDEDFKGVCPFHGNCLEGMCTNVSIATRLGLSDVEQNKDIPDDHSVWNKVGYYLGVCCSNLILTISVEKIVIGGGVMNREQLYDIIRKHCFEALKGYISHPSLESPEALQNIIVKSKFGSDLGIIAACVVGA